MMYRIVPEATYKRRRDRLSPAESERAERLARAIAMAEDVWQDREQTRRFLTTSHPEIGGKTPLEAAMTELGARQAEAVMARILYGLPG
jgi:putative toxin-antitoxin system antitoxin component (TIGR02293 family)